MKKDAARLAARDEAIGEREAELLLGSRGFATTPSASSGSWRTAARWHGEAVAREADLDRRELDLTVREPELNRLQASISHAERDANRGRDLEEWNVRLEQRERELAAREAQLSNYETTADSRIASRRWPSSRSNSPTRSASSRHTSRRRKPRFSGASPSGGRSSSAATPRSQRPDRGTGSAPRDGLTHPSRSRTASRLRLHRP